MAFECEGILPEPPSKIVFDRQSRIFTWFFKRADKTVDVDCPIDDEMMAAIEDQKVCGVGCYQDGKKLAALLVPFEQKQAA
ncbi:MAG: hypothetical protein H6867_07985 [Rhodospirillales bacterium]|nr:hypothetical protein [Rhodospirillales bacterium]MCB9995492.1 hypothetical protein [Rhodospirillales bacterium]